MKKMKFDLPEVGRIAEDKVLFFGSYPVLFTCTDDRGGLYVCVCCKAEPDAKKWLITKTSPEMVLKLLKDQISIRDAFVRSSQFRYSIDWNSKNGLSVQRDGTDWDPDTSVYLPTKGEYMESDEGEFSEEIEHYEKMISKEIERKSMVSSFKVSVALSARATSKYAYQVTSTPVGRVFSPQPSITFSGDFPYRAAA